jgi:hypothetical protein
MEGKHATESQHRIVDALRYLYAPEEYEVPQEYREQLNLPGQPGEHTLGSIDQIVPTALEIDRRHGRYNALQNLYYNFQRMQQKGGDVSLWAFLHMVEYCEVGELAFQIDYAEEKVDNHHPDAAVLRGCAFFNHYLRETTPWEDHVDKKKDLSFAKLLNIATYDHVDLLTDTNRKVGHLVRAVRNDIAHHSWLDMQYSYDALVLGARAMIYLLEEQIKRYVEDGELEVPIAPDPVDPQEYFDQAENEFGWSYNSSKKYWETMEVDEMPPV